MVATKLTTQEMERLKHRFQALDANGDGHLSSAEIADACKSLGLNLPESAVGQIMKEADQNFNGLIQFDDFVALVHRYSPEDGSVWGTLLADKPDRAGVTSKLSQQQIEKLRRLFDDLDIDKNGHLSATELHLLFNNVLKMNVPMAEVNAMIRAADTSGNGQIEFQEFLGVLSGLESTKAGLWGKLLRGINADNRLLTEDQIQQLRLRFNQLDLDGNGHVTASELYLMFKALKVPVSQQTLDQLVKDADVNANGEIEFDEFIFLCVNLKSTDNNAWNQLLRATNPNKLQKMKSVATDLFGIKGEADKKDIASYQKKSAFEVKEQGEDRDFWKKTIRQVRGLGKAVQKAQDAEMQVVANDPVLSDPEVRKQLKDQAKANYKPFFLLVITLVQLGMMAAELIVNNGFEKPANNVLFGPSKFTMLKLGAKYGPCMRPNATQYVLTPLVPCGTLYPQEQATIANATHCLVDYYQYYSYFCQMGGFTIPNQGWRFITPIFLHTGLIELAFTVVFQIWKGFPIERDIGFIRMSIIYFLSGIFGIGWSANMTPNSVSVAGTGPMFALLGLLYLDLFQNWPIIVKPWKWFAILTAIIILLLGIGLLPLIDNYCHLGGFLMGVLTGLVLVPHVSFGVWDGRRKKIAMALAVPLILVCFFAVFFTFYDGKETNFCQWCDAFDCVPPGSAWCTAGGIFF